MIIRYLDPWGKVSLGFWKFCKDLSLGLVAWGEGFGASGV